MYEKNIFLVVRLFNPIQKEIIQSDELTSHWVQKKEWSKVIKYLIDEFWNNEEVLNEISSNIGTYSATWSIIPVLQSHKDLYEKLLSHKVVKVRQRADREQKFLIKQINKERIREEERDL